MTDELSFLTVAEASVDAAQVDLVHAMARKCGLELTERQMAIPLEASPCVLAMADRVRRLHDPANTFRVPGV